MSGVNMRDNQLDQLLVLSNQINEIILASKVGPLGRKPVELQEDFRLELVQFAFYLSNFYQGTIIQKEQKVIQFLGLDQFKQQVHDLFIQDFEQVHYRMDVPAVLKYAVLSDASKAGELDSFKNRKARHANDGNGLYRLYWTVRKIFARFWCLLSRRSKTIF